MEGGLCALVRQLAACVGRGVHGIQTAKALGEVKRLTPTAAKSGLVVFSRARTLI